MPDTTVFELAPHKLDRARPLFAEATFDRVFIDAFFEGRQAGRLFVDDPAVPTSALLCRPYDYFPAGEPTDALRRFIRDAPAEAGVFAVLRDLGIARQKPVTALYGFVPLTDTWHRALLEDHPGQLETIGRRAFRFDPSNAERARRWPERVPDGFTVRPIDAPLARRIDHEQDELIALFWGGYEQFAAGGFGACAMAGDEPASVAYAIAVSSRETNIGVGTADRFQRRGLATAVSLACIAEALDRGLTPTWDCDTGNPASADLALKLGFTEEPSFVELAFPSRGGPDLTTGLWSSEPTATGLVWRRTVP